jgi:hypothetical protein
VIVENTRNAVHREKRGDLALGSSCIFQISDLELLMIRREYAGCWNGENKKQYRVRSAESS